MWLLLYVAEENEKKEKLVSDLVSDEAPNKGADEYSSLTVVTESSITEVTEKTDNDEDSSSCGESYMYKQCIFLSFMLCVRWLAIY